MLPEGNRCGSMHVIIIKQKKKRNFPSVTEYHSRLPAAE